MDESIALVEFSKHSRRTRVKTVAYAHIEVWLKIWFPHRLAVELDCAGRGECVVAEDESAISCACDDGWAGPACNTAVNATASKGAAPATAATSAFAAVLAVLAGLLLLAAVGAFALAEKRKREVTRYERLVREVGSSASTIITASARDDDEDEERARGSSYAAPEDLALPTFSEMKDISTNISPFHDEPLEL